MAGSFPYAYGSEPLAICVALAAELDFSREAIALYTSAAEWLMQTRGRDNYASVARYIARVRDLYRSPAVEQQRDLVAMGAAVDDVEAAGHQVARAQQIQADPHVGREEALLLEG